MRLFFSDRPGARERHVKRRWRNVLFPAERREPTQAEVNEARRGDEAEQAAFAEAFTALLREAVELPPQADSEVVLALRERTDRLYEQCSRLGGDHAAERAGLRKLYDHITAAIRKGAQDDPTALAELAQGEAARALHLELLEHPLVADLLDPQSVVAEDELVPTLLSESETTLAAVMQLFDDAQRRELCRNARKLLMQRATERLDVGGAWERLAVMEKTQPVASAPDRAP